MEKIAVYCMPGLAASSKIFEYISLPEDQFELHCLEWELPLVNETLSQYAQRMCLQIKHSHPVLLGVSFGGILVQEMALHIPVRKVIIVSSVKCRQELPLRLRFDKLIRFYQFVPVQLVKNLNMLARYSFGKKYTNRIKLYERYLSVRDEQYLRWAVKCVVLWDRVEPDPSVIHIHGSNDGVFPVSYLKNFIALPQGTHVMILNKFRWFNQHLPKLIMD